MRLLYLGAGIYSFRWFPPSFPPIPPVKRGRSSTQTSRLFHCDPKKFFMCSTATQRRPIVVSPGPPKLQVFPRAAFFCNVLEDPGFSPPHPTFMILTQAPAEQVIVNPRSCLPVWTFRVFFSPRDSCLDFFLPYPAPPPYSPGCGYLASDSVKGHPVGRDGGPTCPIPEIFSPPTLHTGLRLATPFRVILLF